jgi:hypothetical protein
LDNNLTWHGFLLSGGRYTIVDHPNGGTGAFQGSLLSNLNDHGEILGGYIDSSYGWHAFLLSGGQYTSLDEPNAHTGFYQGTEAFGITNSGQVVGDYWDASAVIHGFLAAPVHGNSPHGAAPQMGSDRNLARSPGAGPVLLALAPPVSSTGSAGTGVGHGLAALSARQTQVLVSLPSGPRSAADSTGRVEGDPPKPAGGQHAGLVEDLFSQVDALFTPLAAV